MHQAGWRPDASYLSGTPPTGAVEISPLQAAYDHKWKILLFALLLTALASMVLGRLPVRYTASASVTVDVRRLQVIDSQSVLSNPTLDFDRLRTIMEEFRSVRIARSVVDELGLAHDPQFCPPAQTDSCAGSVEDAAQRLLEAVTASNDGRSYIITVNADASTPRLAARLADAYADAFVAAQRRELDEAATQADAWLSSYLDGLATQTQQADAAVERYQRTNQLTPLRGETLSGQQLAELNSQLTVATSALAQKQGELQQVETALGRGGLDASLPAVLASPVIQQLVERESELQAHEAELRTQYGGSYPAVQATEAQLARLRQAIGAQAAKAIDGLRADVSALANRKDALTATLKSLQGSVGTQGTANVRLEELQRTADADHHLYEAMLTRLHEVDAERHMQWPSARVVVPAQLPLAPAFPRKKMMLAGSFMVGLGLGAALAYLRSLTARGFRDIEQVEAITGRRVLGLFPRPPRGCRPDAVVAEWPASAETETLYYVLANLTRAEAVSAEARAVLVTSAVPSEGKTSFCRALAEVAVHSGLSVALLDCAMIAENRASLAPPPAGARAHAIPVPALAGGTFMVGASDARRSGGSAALHILPIRALAPDQSRLFASAQVANGFRQLREQFDLVLIDTPSVLTASDALALGPFIDEALLLFDWRRTPRHSVLAALRALQRVQIDVVGLVLTKMDLPGFARRQSAGEGLYAGRYGRPRRTAAL